MKEERRKAFRAKKPLAIAFCDRAKPVWHWERGVIRNVSDSGLCIAARGCVGKGHTLQLRLEIPGRPRRHLLLSGKVIAEACDNKDLALIHIRLRRLSGRATALLREYIAWVLVNERGA